MRVQAVVQGLPDTIGGGFDYKGSDQRVPAKTYRNLFLTGSGTKTSYGGDFAVRSDVTIQQGIIFTVDSGAVVDLGGLLHESGYFDGKIRKTEVLSGLTGSSDFGGIGAQISWRGAAPDSTVVLRTSGNPVQGQGNNSILRIYDIRPKNNAGLDATFVYHFNKNELGSQNEEKLVLWSSSDNGATWNAQGGILDTINGTLTKTNISSFGLWTASDSLHPLGPFRHAASIFMVSGNNQAGAIYSTLQPFVVSIISSDSVPMAGEKVTFAIIGSPDGAQGQSVSDTIATTDAQGHAYTTLKFGSKTGTYTVAAVANGLAGSPLRFSANAHAGAPKLIALASPQVRTGIVGQLVTAPLAVAVQDSGGNGVSDVLVNFVVSRQPDSSIHASLSTHHRLSDSTGAAATMITLGSKAGVYVVTVTSPQLAAVEFTVEAGPSAPAVIASISGSGQQARVFSLLHDSFVVSIADTFGNPIAGQAVRFAITGAPAGATAQRLTADTVITDSLGMASTRLRLGDKVGEYIVSATDEAIRGAVALFRARAIVGAPATIAMVSGMAQRAPILDPLPMPLVVGLSDSGGNPIAGDTVRFNVSGTPAGASGFSLDRMVVVTDSNGMAGVILTVGDKQGDYTVAAHAPSLPGHMVTVSGFGFIFYADANDDQSVNIADLTTMFDATLGRAKLSPANFIRSDLDSNGVVDGNDEKLLIKGLLSGTYDTLGTINGTPSIAGLKASLMPNGAVSNPSLVSGELELTSHGLRFNLNNTIPLRGLELVFRLKRTAAVGSSEVFKRADVMQAPVNSGSGLVRIIAYNGENRQIDAGTGSVFRMPVVLADTSDLELIGAIAADTGNHAVIIPVVRTQAPLGKYPESFALLQNYPNPFNNETKIEYTVPDVAGQFDNTLLQVFDITGRKIRTIVKGEQESGHYTATWDGRNDDGSVVASGVYIVRLWSPNVMMTMKMMLMK